tara:strand:+ start:64 stop:462 length:399 start_codon:yes stop_codon:yes gene_type:complete
VKVIKVTGAIIQEGNKFLICRRGPSEKAAGLWEFPGGKLETNESLEDCILRELKEELDIDAELHSLYDNYSFKSKYVIYDLYFFRIKGFSGNLSKTVHDEIKWVNLKDFHNFSFLPGDAPLIKKLEKDNRIL